MINHRALHATKLDRCRWGAVARKTEVLSVSIETFISGGYALSVSQ